jgi:ABC-2 type transport system permease protein
VSAARSMTQLGAVVVKEARQTLRDRRMMAFIFFVPLVQLVVFGFAVDLDVDRVPTVIVDHDGSRRSREHIRRLLADGTLVEVARTRDEAEAEAMLEAGTATVVVVVPAGHDRASGRGDPTEVQVVVDGGDPNRGTVAAAAAQRFFGRVVLEQRELAGAELPPVAGVRMDPRVAFNPSLETPVFMVPGIAALLLIIITTIVTAMGLSREREAGTLEQVLVTPLRPAVVILGKLIPFAIIGLVDFSLAMAAGSWVFGMPIRGSLLFLLGATLLYLLSTLGMGLLISTLARSQQQAFMGGFAVMLPAVLLGGIMTPISSMPEWLRPVTYLNPVRYYGEVLRAVVLKGATAEDVLPQLVALGLFGLVLVTVAAMRFRKQLG